jgi:5-methylcytosine-specific restriction endonuclease McrA
VEVLHLDRGVRGTVEPATVVDHVKPHKGDWTDFITGELQSLCEPCHNSAKRRIDGYPTDPNHRFNRAR